MADMNNGRAVIEGDAMLIRLPIDYLPQVVEGAWALNAMPVRMQITDAGAFAKELVRVLNREDEQGTTMIHRMMDSAIVEALEQGAEGIEEHPQQSA